MDHQIVEQDKTRLEALERCRIMIEEGLKLGRDAMRQISQALVMINDQELYKDVGCESLYEYCEHHLSLDRSAAYRLMCSGETVLTLEKGGIDTAQIPALESQLVLLHKIPAEQLADAWRDGLIAMERENIPVTMTSIKRLVDYVTKAEPPAAELGRGPRGVNPTLSIDGQKVMSEQGELALERIGRIAGAQVRRAIEQGTLELSEREIIRWAEEDDIMVKNLAHYIVNLRWSLIKAKTYEQTMITGATTINSLATLATARGGEYEGEIILENREFEFRIRLK